MFSLPHSIKQRFYAREPSSGDPSVVPPRLHMRQWYQPKENQITEPTHLQFLDSKTEVLQQEERQIKQTSLKLHTRTHTYVKCLPCKCEDMSSDLQNPCKSPGVCLSFQRQNFGMNQLIKMVKMARSGGSGQYTMWCTTENTT